MQIIAHRRNSIQELINTPTHYGIEVDIRSSGQRLVIHHDPFVMGEDFEEWLASYQHQLLVLNVKEEGLEARLIALMQQYKIANYFFLDQSFPFLIKWTKLGESRCAIRISEYESISTALTLTGKAQWVWVDFFSRFPLDATSGKQLKEAGFKLCLVSPELQGINPITAIPRLKELIRHLGIKIDAVCTKQPDLWE